MDRLDETPDLPLPFGRGTAWFAVRSRDVDQVARVLGLRTSRPANWASGLAGAGEGLFVARCGGFVCAIGADAWHRGDLASVGAALQRLSAIASEACWFGIDEDGDRFGWALARGGTLERAFCCDGGDRPIVMDEGPITVAEAKLGFFVDDPRDRSDDPIKWWPTAADVLALAARWTVDPMRAAAAAPAAPAAIGRLGRW